jgi:hypothetical protein
MPLGWMSDYFYAVTSRSRIVIADKALITQDEILMGMVDDEE